MRTPRKPKNSSKDHPTRHVTERKTTGPGVPIDASEDGRVRRASRPARHCLAPPDRSPGRRRRHDSSREIYAARGASVYSRSRRHRSSHRHHRKVRRRRAHVQRLLPPHARRQGHGHQQAQVIPRPPRIIDFISRLALQFLQCQKNPPARRAHDRPVQALPWSLVRELHDVSVALEESKYQSVLIVFRSTTSRATSRRGSRHPNTELESRNNPTTTPPLALVPARAAMRLFAVKPLTRRRGSATASRRAPRAPRAARRRAAQTSC